MHGLPRHAKVVDFLLCVFGPVLEEREAGVIRLTAEAFNVASRLLNVAQAHP